MTDTQTIARFLESDEWTYAEKFIIKWQFDLLGDFYKALTEAIKCADDDNLTRLGVGFPQEVDGFLAWNRGDLGTRLRNAGLEI